MTDDVLEGVRAAREAFAEAHGYDIHAMVAALRRLNEAGDWPVVSLPPRLTRGIGSGDYTAERVQLFAGRTVAELAADIRATVQPTQPSADPAGT